MPAQAVMDGYSFAYNIRNSNHNIGLFINECPNEKPVMTMQFLVLMVSLYGGGRGQSVSY